MKMKVAIVICLSMMVGLNVYAEREVKVAPVSSTRTNAMDAEIEKVTKKINGIGTIRTLKESADAKWICEMFMLKLVNSGVQEAFDELRPYFALEKEEIDMIQIQTYQQMEAIRPRYGEVVGYTLLKEEILGDTVLKYTYLQKFERHAIRWLFFFYKPGNTWIFNEFYVDDKLRELFE